MVEIFFFFFFFFFAPLQLVRRFLVHFKLCLLYVVAQDINRTNHNVLNRSMCSLVEIGVHIYGLHLPCPALLWRTFMNYSTILLLFTYVQRCCGFKRYVRSVYHILRNRWGGAIWYTSTWGKSRGHSLYSYSLYNIDSAIAVNWLVLAPTRPWEEIGTKKFLPTCEPMRVI